MIHLNNVGTPYEIGRQHGASCPQATRMAYAAYGQLDGLRTDQIDSTIRLLEARLHREFADSLEEIRGIADGSGLDYDQAMTLNFPSVFVGRSLRQSDCSCISLPSSDHGVLLGKTADWSVPGAYDFTTWQRYRPRTEQALSFLHYGCAGTIWTEGGLNEAGLGMVLNGLPVGGSPPTGVPTAVLTRGVLASCRSTREAVAFLSRYDVVHWGFSLLLADAGGNVVAVEVVPGAQLSRRVTSGCFFHTNHPLFKETSQSQLAPQAQERHAEPGLLENSHARYRTLQRILPGIPRTLEGMKAVLRNRSASGSVSQAGEDGHHTVFAMIVAPQAGVIWGAEGFPPEVPFVDYAL